MNFSSDYLLEQLHRYPEPPCYWVAFSGGLDSQVLLHVLALLRTHLDADMGAVHVNHGLQSAADHWEEHCRQVCADLDISYVSLAVDGQAAPGESPEAAARAARYAALADWLPAGHHLLTAQHQDDQAETLLLQLLRGSGVAGLGAMPSSTTLGAGQHLRPLLAIPRVALHAYAVAQQLSWIEDPSNADTAFDRNFLRQEVVPLLRKRWPAVAASLSRSAAHCAEASRLTGQLAADDLCVVVSRRKHTLSITALTGLPDARRRNVMRHWIRLVSGLAPSTAVLARITNDVLHSRPDANPCVRWGDFEVRRYRDDLFLLRQTGQPDCPEGVEWTLQAPLPVPTLGGVLTATAGAGCGIRASAVSVAPVRVSWRKGGECCRPTGRAHHHSLKKLFQEGGIPPWERSRVPLIYIGDRLAAVAGLWVCEPFQAGPAESGLRIDWQPLSSPPTRSGN